jgi:hypothetical protein
MTYKHFCEKCDYKCRDISNWDKHIATKKHNSIKSDFECRACNYTCSIKSLMDKHMNTQRHNTKIKQAESIQNETEPQPKPQDKDDRLMEIVKQLLTQNNDLKNFIIEQAAEHKKETIDMVNKVIENVKPTCNISNTTISNNNKAFNINMYLNEQCKDAINFSDFINGIEVSHEDLENNAQLGFVGGVSKILIDNLKLMNRNERPIHCTDVKRETMYIKDDNKWTKEENDSKLRSAIQEITRKSISSLMAWKRGNPESDDMDSAFSGRCIVIQQQSMAGYNREVYYPKVIHAIAREVFVSK